MKVLLVVLMINGLSGHNPSAGKAIDTTVWDTMEECEVVKNHLLEILPEALSGSGTKATVKCLSSK